MCDHHRFNKGVKRVIAPAFSMKPERSELASGIFFNRIPVDKFKTSRFSISFVTPLTDNERAAKIALLSSVLRQGTVTYKTPAALSRRQEELYSAILSSIVTKIGDYQLLTFSVNFLSNAFVPNGEDLLPMAMDLLGEVVFKPLIDENSGVFVEEYVAVEKRNLINRIASVQNNKAVYAAHRCTAIMHQDEPHGVFELGTQEAVEQITPASLYAAYRALLSEARIEVFYSGADAVEPIVSWLVPQFSGIRRYPCRLAPVKVVRRVAKHRIVNERSDATQARLCIGFRTGIALGEKDTAALILFNYLYAAAPTSKLFANVRERLSLCYSCSSTLNLLNGTLMVTAGIETKKRNKATREIFRQLKKTRRGRITEREFSMALKTMQAQYMVIFDSPVAVERWYLVRFLAGLTETLSDFAEALTSLTVNDVTAVAKKLSLDTLYFLRGTQEGEVEEEEEDE